MKLKDMTKDQLEKLATARKLPGRSKLTKLDLITHLVDQEINTRIARFSNEPGDAATLTPKQARRVKQKINRHF